MSLSQLLPCLALSFPLWMGTVALGTTWSKVLFHKWGNREGRDWF